MGEWQHSLIRGRFPTLAEPHLQSGPVVYPAPMRKQQDHTNPADHGVRVLVPGTRPRQSTWRVLPAQRPKIAGMATDYSRAARTPLDQEFTYLAFGMVGGAIPGIIAGFVVAAFLGHPAMWLSVCGGIGIVIGLVLASLIYRRRRNRAARSTARERAQG